MIGARSGAVWQTTLADLSLILFMITASAIGRGENLLPPVQSQAPPVQSGQLAIYRAEPGAPSFNEWLTAQAADRRQLLTIVARYHGDKRAEALARAAVLAAGAARAGFAARIIVEPGEGAVSASLGFDRSGAMP